MHGYLVVIGVVLVLVVGAHLLFDVIKFTVSVFLLGVVLIGILYIFQHYFGIDLIGVIERHV